MRFIITRSGNKGTSAFQTATKFDFHWIRWKLFLYCSWVWIVVPSAWNGCIWLQVFDFFTHEKSWFFNIKCLRSWVICSWSWRKTSSSNAFSFLRTKSPFGSIGANSVLCDAISRWWRTESFINSTKFFAHAKWIFKKVLTNLWNINKKHMTLITTYLQIGSFFFIFVWAS